MVLEEMNILGVIPARGGSKGVPRKNMRMLHGRPLLAWTIDAALDSGITDLLVSSEDAAILQYARPYAGCLKRPSELATDDASSLSVVRHALDFAIRLLTGRKTIDAVLLLQPTCPLRTSADIDAAVEKMEQTGCDSVISVVDVGAHHPARMKKLIGDVAVNYLDDQKEDDMRPRQLLPKVYIRSGDIYLAKRDLVMQHNTLVGGDVRAIVIPPERHVNIDTLADFERAERMMCLSR